jgi:hypothetical protein
MSATYIINNNPDNYQKFIIPQADIISGSYFLTQNLAANEFWILTFATLQLINSTLPYTGFTFIELRQTGGTNQGIIDTSGLSIPGSIQSNFIYTFAYNTQVLPTKFGAETFGPRYVLSLNGGYVSGNGDFELNFYYKQYFI